MHDYYKIFNANKTWIFMELANLNCVFYAIRKCVFFSFKYKCMGVE